MAEAAGRKGAGLHYKRFGVFPKVKTTDLLGNLRSHSLKKVKTGSQYRKSGQLGHWQ
jgi:hypothetical protein